MSLIPLDFASKINVRPPDGRAAAYEFAEFDPKIHMRQDGTIQPSWEMANVVRLRLPRPLTYVEPGVVITVVAVHRKVAGFLKDAFAEILAGGGWEHLNPYGGGFNVRMERGSAKPSMHSLALALDFNPAGNPYHGEIADSDFLSKPGGGAVVRAFETHGFFWGGRFISNPDAMHFQFATGV